MTRRDELLVALEGISRTEAYDAEARRILSGAASEAELEAAYRRIACSYDPETERYSVCDGHHRCLCRRAESPTPGEQQRSDRTMPPLGSRSAVESRSPGHGDSDLREYAELLMRVHGGRL